jgi:xanthine dehydrogenase iron-sulfur cluster and FAD-binding subunit A
MEPNLCRCGTHMRIIAAISEAAASLRAAGDDPGRAVALAGGKK